MCPVLESPLHVFAFSPMQVWVIEMVSCGLVVMSGGSGERVAHLLKHLSYEESHPQDVLKHPEYSDMHLSFQHRGSGDWWFS